MKRFKDADGIVHDDRTYRQFTTHRSTRGYDEPVADDEVITCIECIALEGVETCGAEGCERGTVCGDGAMRCYRCGRQRA